MFQTIISSEGITTGQGIICLIVALALGIVISVTYMKTGEYSKNFARTLIVMPVLYQNLFQDKVIRFILMEQ